MSSCWQLRNQIRGNPTKKSTEESHDAQEHSKVREVRVMRRGEIQSLQPQPWPTNPKGRVKELTYTSGCANNEDTLRRGGFRLISIHKLVGIRKLGTHSPAPSHMLHATNPTPATHLQLGLKQLNTRKLQCSSYSHFTMMGIARLCAASSRRQRKRATIRHRRGICTHFHFSPNSVPLV